MIVIVDCGMGNLRSVQKKVERAGSQAMISDRAEDIAHAEKLILPGVGHFGRAMDQINRRGLRDLLRERVLNHGTPVLGICLGMQLFTEGSEEGSAEGLGLIRGSTVRFPVTPPGSPLRTPHMGWNTLCIQERGPLLESISETDRFYFVHSYYVRCENTSDVAASTGYGCSFVSAIQRGIIWGTQFHPEKSHGSGMRILANFVASRPKTVEMH